VSNIELREKITALKEHISKGEEFERAGYDCGMMNELNRVLLAELEATLAATAD
jgi:hypothetical protein